MNEFLKSDAAQMLISASRSAPARLFTSMPLLLAMPVPVHCSHNIYNAVRIVQMVLNPSLQTVEQARSGAVSSFPCWNAIWYSTYELIPFGKAQYQI